MFKPKLNFGHPGFVAGRYYTSAGFVTNSTLLLVENTLYFQPFFAPERVAIDRLAFAITVGAGNAANEVRTGVYNTVNARPGNLLIDNRALTRTNPPTLWFLSKTNQGRLLKIVYIQNISYK